MKNNTDHPCLCDICLKARDDEIKRTKKEMVEAAKRFKYPPETLSKFNAGDNPKIAYNKALDDIIYFFTSSPEEK